MPIRVGKLLPKQRAFLKLFAQNGVVTHSATAVGINRTMAYEWRKTDLVFAAAFEDAAEMAADVLEQEAFRRAHDGVEKYVVSNGRVVMYAPDGEEAKPLIERVYSDKLLELLMQARRPEKFRARSDVKVNGAISVTFTEPGDKEL